MRINLWCFCVCALALALGACGGGDGGGGGGEGASTTAPVSEPDVEAFEPLLAAQPTGSLQRWMASYPGDVFSAELQAKAGAFFDAQSAYQRGDYAAAKRLLDTIWARYPVASASWMQGGGLPGLAEQEPYYALRLLTDATTWRLRRQAAGLVVKPQPLVLTVLMPLKSLANNPATLAELTAGAGPLRTRNLDARAAADNGLALREALWLYGEYLLACTDGRVQLQMRVWPLNMTAQLRVGESGGTGQVAFQNYDELFAAVPYTVRRTTDQWWLLYPGVVPQAPAIRDTTWFIAGGMSGHDKEPVFVSDDTWLLQRSRNNQYGAAGPSTTEDRLNYFPQWIHHEFFHHLAQRYPELALEPTSHNWFNRATWPADFVGVHEPDYFNEAMRRRVLAPDGGSAELARRLWHKRPGVAFFGLLDVQAILGRYEVPVEGATNEWLRGVIERHPQAGQAGVPPLRWTNDAGVSWGLTPDVDAQGKLRSGVLTTGADNPYAATLPTMDVVLNMDFAAPKRSTVRAVWFGGDFVRVP